MMPSKGTKIKIFECNQYQESDKALFVIYAELKCLIEKIDACRNNPENLSTTKVGEKYHQVFQCLQCDYLNT